MKDDCWRDARPDEVLEFWFPDDGHGDAMETHQAFWQWRMQGGADAEIIARFADTAEAAARGLLDHWAETPRGRLALIIALDQFPRSIHRGLPAAYGQDIKATRLALEALDNGDFDALANVWEKQFLLIAISHCEGPDHCERMDRLLEIAKILVDEAPEPLRPAYVLGVEQVSIVRDVIIRFGRHPHRNEILGRITTAEEKPYLEKGEFPHERRMAQPPEELARHVEEVAQRFGL